ncbi:MAG: hypothetical protein ABSG17_15915 [Spirochaetia bacterium]|jgi:tetratricopeptide (TPR) repeat protein
MPRKEDIEKFKEVLNSLGGEPEIMARRSQTIEEVLPPDEAPSAGLGDLPGAPGAHGELQPAQPEEPPLEDFGLDLTSLDEPGEIDVGGIEAGGEAAEEPVPSGESPGEEGGLDFGSLFGDETTPSSIEDLEQPPGPQPQEDLGAEEAGPQPGASEADEFTLPESESASMQADLSQMEVLPEDIGEPPAPGEETAPALPEEALPEAPSEEALAGIELPNLEDLSLSEPLPGTEGETAPEAAAPPSEETAEQAGAEGLEIPSLEDFDLGAGPGAAEEAAAPQGLPAPPAEPAPEAEEPPAPAGKPGEEGLGDLGLEDFSFAETPGQFAAEAEPAAEVAPAKPAAPARGERRAAPEAAPLPELAGAEAEVKLTQEQFNRLKRTLESLPRNLKMAVQDVIGDGRATGPALSTLVSLLVAGAAAQEIAAVVGRITGKRIVVPAGYEKKSGVAFEAEQRSFAYALRQNILPLVRLFALTVLAAALIGFLGYRFVYRPLYALANYRVGYTHILGDRFTLANERFERARQAAHIKRWYYRYAEGFSEKRQYVLAEQKYDQLLQDFPGDHKGVLDYARMESLRLADYKKADDLLKIILGNSPYDLDALVAAGDNNLEWAGNARPPDDKVRYEAARLDYATLIDKYGTRDVFLFRMMRYFIRTDDAQEIERLRLYFAARPGQRVDPAVYAELGGYLVDHRQLDHAQEVLFKAEEAKPDLAEIHYNLARYYRLTQRPDDEMLALNATVKLLRPSDPLTPKRLAMEIDTHTRLGELYDQQGRYINGEKELADAVSKVEESQRSRLIGTGSVFGRPYADLGDLHYYIIGDLDTARTFYQKAIDNSYFDPALDYKMGFTQYGAGDYAAALASFARTEAEWGLPPDRDAPPPIVPTPSGPVDYSGKAPANLLFAMGNCFYLRGDFFAAQGYYLRLRDRLEAQRVALGTLFPQEKPEHRALLETLVKVNNNLGVVMDRLAARTGDRNKRSEALVYLAGASQIADTLTRTPDSRSTGGAKNLPFLNQRGILYPVSGFVPQISRDIPRDLGTIFW